MTERRSWSSSAIPTGAALTTILSRARASSLRSIANRTGLAATRRPGFAARVARDCDTIAKPQRDHPPPASAPSVLERLLDNLPHTCLNTWTNRASESLIEGMTSSRRCLRKGRFARQHLLACCVCMYQFEVEDTLARIARRAQEDEPSGESSCKRSHSSEIARKSRR
jgi:hypothetical protein